MRSTWTPKLNHLPARRPVKPAGFGAAGVVHDDSDHTQRSKDAAHIGRLYAAAFPTRALCEWEAKPALPTVWHTDSPGLAAALRPGPCLCKGAALSVLRTTWRNGLPVHDCLFCEAPTGPSNEFRQDAQLRRIAILDESRRERTSPGHAARAMRALRAYGFEQSGMSEPRSAHRRKSDRVLAEARRLGATGLWAEAIGKQLGIEVRTERTPRERQRLASADAEQTRQILAFDRVMESYLVHT